MEVNGILDAVIHDCQNCATGLLENDPHLLSDGAQKLANHISMLINIISGESQLSTRRCMESLLQNLQCLRDEVEEKVRTRTPRFDTTLSLPLDAETVLEFRKQGMTWSKVAKVHGISRNSLYKYRKRHGVEEPNKALTDEELREHVSSICVEHPNSGVCLTRSALLSSGFRASKDRVWRCLREVDPIGVAVRRSKPIKRRAYKSDGANFMWHMDSNHKLIMFRFVIHGCVDGYSRLVTHLNVSNNNSADVALSFFEASVAEFNLPKRVRGDKGVENNRVKAYMERRSTAKDPFIHGRSVHNTRIERLWRDVNIQVVSKFKPLFQSMEANGNLDENSYLDLYCLSYVFLPRIQKSLDNFKMQWNNHTIRTMNNETPMQRWNFSIRQQREESSSHINQEIIENLNIDDEVEENSVFFIPHDVLAEMELLMPDPLSDDGAKGINHYLLLRSHIQNIVT